MANPSSSKAPSAGLPRSPIRPQHRQPLTEAEWLFDKDRVPDSELIACLLWEYLRESQTVAELAQEWREFHARGAKGSCSKLLERTMRIQPELNFPFERHDFVARLVQIEFGLEGRFGVPWQQLPKGCRAEYARWASVAPAVFVTGPAYLRDFRSALAEFECADPLHPNRVVLRRNASKRIVGQELVLLVINWPAYDDGQIRAALEEFAKSQRRPEDVQPAIKAGRGLGRTAELRGKLRSLGAARLQARYPVAQLKREVPTAYDHWVRKLADNGPTAVDKALRAARKAFENSFKGIFGAKEKTPLCLVHSRLAR